MDVPPHPCAVIESNLCVTAAYAGALTISGIYRNPVRDLAHPGAVARLGAEIVDDGGDALLIEPPPPDSLEKCLGPDCIKYRTACSTQPLRIQCKINLYLPWYTTDPTWVRRQGELLWREITISGQSIQVFTEAVASTYVVTGEKHNQLIPLRDLINLQQVNP